jgi:hypothetical protein
MEMIKQEDKSICNLSFGLLGNSQLQATKDGFRMALLQLSRPNFIPISTCSTQLSCKKLHKESNHVPSWKMLVNKNRGSAVAIYKSAL